MKTNTLNTRVITAGLFLIIFCSGCATKKLWTENVYRTKKSDVLEKEEKNLPLYFRTSEEDPGRIGRIFVDLKGTDIPQVWQLTDGSLAKSAGFEPRYFEIWGKNIDDIVSGKKITSIETDIFMADDEHDDGTYKGKCKLYFDGDVQEYEFCWIRKRYTDFSYYRTVNTGKTVPSFKARVGYSEKVVDWKLVPLKVLATPFTLAFDAVTGHGQILMSWGYF